MFVNYQHESIRLTGRWDRGDAAATCTATGSYIEFAFRGTLAVARFDIENNMLPYLHLWIEIDGGDRVEVPIDRYLRIWTKHDGDHVCRIIYKGGTEVSDRWFLPLRGKVTFLGVQTETPLPIAPDDRPTIEFVGDSITEGVLIDTDFHEGARAPFTLDQLSRCYLDDVCATYAWLTAEALGLRPVFMGYGAVGVTRAGCAGVPAAPESYPFNFENSPITHKPCDYILINHGANDRGKDPEVYAQKYAELLDVIRARNPQSVIICLSAFCGVHHETLGKTVEEYNKTHGCNVHFIDSDGWIPPTPVHPLRDGHRTVAEHLIPLVREIIKK